jgi:hypothetical protein
VTDSAAKTGVLISAASAGANTRAQSLNAAGLDASIRRGSSRPHFSTIAAHGACIAAHCTFRAWVGVPPCAADGPIRLIGARDTSYQSFGGFNENRAEGFSQDTFQTEVTLSGPRDCAPNHRQPWCLLP